MKTFVTIAGFGSPIGVEQSISEIRHELDTVSEDGWIRLDLSGIEAAGRQSERELYVRPSAIVAFFRPQQVGDASEVVEREREPDVQQRAAEEARARGMSLPAPEHAEAFLRDVAAGLAPARLDAPPEFF